MIDYDAGLPPWAQLRDILRGRIERGEITGKLPSETTLHQEYGLALGTVRKAVASLREAGLIYTVRGWGSFVTPPDQRP